MAWPAFYNTLSTYLGNRRTGLHPCSRTCCEQQQKQLSARASAPTSHVTRTSLGLGSCFLNMSAITKYRCQCCDHHILEELLKHHSRLYRLGCLLYFGDCPNSLHILPNSHLSWVPNCSIERYRVHLMLRADGLPEGWCFRLKLRQRTDYGGRQRGSMLDLGA